MGIFVSAFTSLFIKGNVIQIVDQLLLKSIPDKLVLFLDLQLTI